MKRKILALGLVCLTLIPAAAWAEEVNPVVGHTGDYFIRESDMERLIGNQPPEAQKRFQDNPELKAGFVSQILMDRAVAARARKEGFDRKPEIKEQLGLFIDGFLTQEYLRRVVMRDVEVPEEELKKYYHDNEKDLVLPAGVRVSQIFVAVPGGASGEVKAKAKAKAEELLKRLQNGEEFAALAKTVSEDPESAAQGGDIGFITPGKSNAPEFEKEVLALKEGELAVVSSPFGFHVVRIAERREQRQATFDEAREFIRATLKPVLEEKKAREFLEKVAKEAGLELDKEKIVGRDDKPELAK